MRDHWEHFEYGAKVGVRGIAVSKGGAFERAAFAMMAVFGEPLCPPCHRPVVQVKSATRTALRVARRADGADGGRPVMRAGRLLRRRRS